LINLLCHYVPPGKGIYHVITLLGKNDFMGKHMFSCYAAIRQNLTLLRSSSLVSAAFSQLQRRFCNTKWDYWPSTKFL